MTRKRAIELVPGDDRILVDRLVNPLNPSDYADVYEEVVAIEPIGPALRVYTEKQTFIIAEDAEVDSDG